MKTLSTLFLVPLFLLLAVSLSYAQEDPSALIRRAIQSGEEADMQAVIKAASQSENAARISTLVKAAMEQDRQSPIGLTDYHLRLLYELHLVLRGSPREVIVGLLEGSFARICDLAMKDLSNEGQASLRASAQLSLIQLFDRSKGEATRYWAVQFFSFSRDINWMWITKYKTESHRQALGMISASYLVSQLKNRGKRDLSLLVSGDRYTADELLRVSETWEEIRKKIQEAHLMPVIKKTNGMQFNGSEKAKDYFAAMNPDLAVVQLTDFLWSAEVQDLPPPLKVAILDTAGLALSSMSHELGQGRFINVVREVIRMSQLPPNGEREPMDVEAAAIRARIMMGDVGEPYLAELVKRAETESDENMLKYCDALTQSVLDRAAIIGTTGDLEEREKLRKFLHDYIEKVLKSNHHSAVAKEAFVDFVRVVGEKVRNVDTAWMIYEPFWTFSQTSLPEGLSEKLKSAVDRMEQASSSPYRKLAQIIRSWKKGEKAASPSGELPRTTAQSRPYSEAIAIIPLDENVDNAKLNSGDRFENIEKRFDLIESQGFQLVYAVVRGRTPESARQRIKKNSLFELIHESVLYNEKALAAQAQLILETAKALSTQQILVFDMDDERRSQIEKALHSASDSIGYKPVFVSVGGHEIEGALKAGLDLLPKAPPRRTIGAAWAGDSEFMEIYENMGKAVLVWIKSDLNDSLTPDERDLLRKVHLLFAEANKAGADLATVQLAQETKEFRVNNRALLMRDIMLASTEALSQFESQLNETPQSLNGSTKQIEKSKENFVGFLLSRLNSQEIPMENLAWLFAKAIRSDVPSVSDLAVKTLAYRGSRELVQNVDARAEANGRIISRILIENRKIGSRPTSTGRMNPRDTIDDFHPEEGAIVKVDPTKPGERPELKRPPLERLIREIIREEGEAPK